MPDQYANLRRILGRFLPDPDQEPKPDRPRGDDTDESQNQDVAPSA